MGFCFGGGKAIRYTTMRQPAASTIVCYGAPVLEVWRLACVCARARACVRVCVRVFVCTPHQDAPTGRLDDRLLWGSRIGGVATCVRVCVRARARARVFVCVRLRVFVCTPHHDAPTGRLDDRLLRGSRVGNVATCVCLRAYAHARVLFACVCVCLYVRHTTTRRLAASIIICYGAPVLEV